MSVNPEVVRVITEFHAAGKPQALCCIAPILAAKVGWAMGHRISLTVIHTIGHWNNLTVTQLYSWTKGIKKNQLKYGN